LLPKTNSLANSQYFGSKSKDILNVSDDATSTNKSTATQGGGLALRIVRCLG